MSESSTEEFAQRIGEYMLKAIREAKVNTSWNDPDPSYGEAVARFVQSTLTGSESAAFLRDFVPFQKRIGRVGVVHSLTQTCLKIASPGVPDVYQGCELWDLSLVDPDNRRPIDYELRQDSLARIDGALEKDAPRNELVHSLLNRFEDGAIKQYVVAMALRFRRDQVDLLAQGVYRPLEAEGTHRSRLIAFGRYRENRSMIVAGARLAAPLMGADAERWPVGNEVWDDTRLVLPEGPIPRRWRDLFTDRQIEIGNEPVIPVADLFETLPVAWLVSDP